MTRLRAVMPTAVILGITFAAAAWADAPGSPVAAPAAAAARPEATGSSTLIPTPGTLALLGLAGAMVFFRRSRHERASGHAHGAPAVESLERAEAA
ncbi:MAG: PEP-CTERM sorting domain-containing protein [Phycisphaerales bacterium]|nr:PEP-CTERM sorting domain-containing protein [Phycisphaerales bacterium]